MPGLASEQIGAFLITVASRCFEKVIPSKTSGIDPA
jgi:hypothetical protein